MRAARTFSSLDSLLIYLDNHARPVLGKVKCTTLFENIKTKNFYLEGKQEFRDQKQIFIFVVLNQNKHIFLEVFNMNCSEHFDQGQSQ